MNPILDAFIASMPRDLDAVLAWSVHNRRYITDFDADAGAVLIDRNKALALLDGRYIEQGRALISGLDVRKTEDGFLADVARLIAEAGIRRVGAEEKQLSCSEWEAFKAAFPGVELVPCSDLFRQCRQRKHPTEIQRIKKAQAITDDAFRHILEFVRPGRTEKEIALELEFYGRSAGADSAAFDFIVLSGENTSKPHGTPGTRSIRQGDLVTMDFGFKVGGYCSDMTRTIAVGSLSEEQREVYELVLQAQQVGIDCLRAGVVGAEPDLAVRKLFAGHGFEEQFAHALGHSLGLEVHESPALSPRCGERIPAGAVMTVEPGLYFEGRFGVRIEDMIYVSKQGGENLTHSPKGLIIL
jgi:Xaa-Pro aminopeptidase